MKKIEANTLEEAYAKAAKLFDCSVTDLEYEIVQHPSNGFLGIGAKKAIIVAACKAQPVVPQDENKPSSATPTPQPHVPSEKKPDNPSPAKTEPVVEKTIAKSEGSEVEILNGFFDEKAHPVHPDTSTGQPSIDEKELGRTLEEQLGTLMRSACFEIDTVEVDVIDKTAYIFIDGEDAALLIGKEGYRYNAISYLLYNWIHNEYGLYIKLEIAQFLASQQEMIRNYIQPVIEHVHQQGWGKTRPLDGILVQITLEQLREEFPNKYVAIKRTREGERYILINEFNKRS